MRRLRRLEDVKDDELRPEDNPGFILHVPSKFAFILLKILRKHCKREEGDEAMCFAGKLSKLSRRRTSIAFWPRA